MLKLAWCVDGIHWSTSENERGSRKKCIALLWVYGEGIREKNKTKKPVRNHSTFNRGSIKPWDPDVSTWVEHLALPPNSDFFLLYTGRAAGDGSTSWRSTTYVGDLDWVSSFEFGPGPVVVIAGSGPVVVIAGIWGWSSERELSLCKH